MALQKEMSINLGLPATPLVDDQKLYLDFLVIYNALRSLGYAIDAYTGIISPPAEDWAATGVTSASRINGTTKVYIITSEDLVVGNTVTFWDDAGTAKVKKAQDGVSICRGFCSANALTGALAEITLIGLYPELAPSSVTPGVTIYQTATAGVLGVTGTQAVGFAMTDSLIFFNPSLV